MKNHSIDSLLPATMKKCVADVRWAYGHSSELALMLQEDQRKIYFEFKKDNTNLSNEELSLAAAYKSAYQLRKLVEKKSINDIEKLEVIEKLNIAKSRPNRKKPKFEWLLNHQSELEAMMADGHSFRDMSRYFLSTHRFSVSHALIANFIKSKKEI